MLQQWRNWKGVFRTIRKRLRPGKTDRVIGQPSPSSAGKALYRYHGLDEAEGQIRLIQLFPGQESDDTLCGRLMAVDLNTDPEYDAVSYVWGDPQRRFSLVIDGQLLPITENLHIALRGLRLGHRSRTLWIDAICIDQADILERGHQVRLMQAVYSNARIVRVWLDVDADFKAAPFLMISRILAPPGYPDMTRLFPKRLNRPIHCPISSHG